MKNENALIRYEPIPMDFEGEIIRKSLYPEPLFEQDGCLFIRGNYGDRQLCNFIPYIEEELVVTDGITESRYLKIGGTHKKGYSLKSVTLSMNEFKKMNWIEEKWGSACNVSAGNSNREQLRFAIQSTAEYILTRKLYSHIGWVYIGSQWGYIMERLYALKDVPTVIDDFHPSTRFEETEMAKTAQLLFRAFGDKTARGRMKSDLTIAEPKPPRGSGIITAEFPPSVSESGTARYLSLEISSNDVDMKVLSELQAMAREHDFQKSMYGYIEFLKNNYLSNHYRFVEQLKNMVLDYRKQFANALKGTGYHDRIPEALSYLAVGFYFLCEYFAASSVKTAENCEQLKNDFYETLCAVGRKQSCEIKIDKPHIKFLTKLNSLIASGNLFFAPKGNYDVPRLAIGGYQDEDFYYLIVDSCQKAVKKFCEEQGENFSVTPRQLLQTLDREGFIETANSGERTRTLNVGGSYVRVAFLRKSKLLEIDDAYS